VSQENLEIVHSIYDAFNRRDTGAILDVIDPAISIEDYGVIDGATYHGLSGVSEFIAFQAASWAGQRVEAKELIEAGDSLVAVVRLSAEGPSSGVPVADEFAHMWELQDGKVRGLRVYRSRPRPSKPSGCRSR
jgi:ketosteroid isomerase-like protein